MQSVQAMLGWPEIIGILIIVVVIFGAKQIPELFKGMGHGIHEFMQATRQVDRDVADDWETEATEDTGKAFRRYGFTFWLIVALGVTAMCAVAVALRELLE